MKDSQKTMKILIGASILIILVAVASRMPGSKRGAQPQLQAPAIGENKTLPQDGSTPPSVSGNDQPGAAPAQSAAAPKESTPAERAARTVSPSDAASFSEEDLPSDAE